MEFEGSSKEQYESPAMDFILLLLSFSVLIIRTNFPGPSVSLLLKGILHSNAGRIPVCACSCLRPLRGSGHLTAVQCLPFHFTSFNFLTHCRTLMSLYVDVSSSKRAACVLQ
jgi:hypothetical protein